jgi:O-antigen ligase
MRAKDYFFNWLILVYGAYLFFSKGLAYSFLTEATLVVGVLLMIRERNQLTFVWNSATKLLAVLLGINLIWVGIGVLRYNPIEVIKDSFIFNYALLLLVPFLYLDRLELFKERIFQLYAWLPLVAFLNFVLVALFPVLEVWSVFGGIPFFEYKRGDLGVQLLITTLLLLSGRIRLDPRFLLLNAVLIAYLFFIVGTFNRGGAVAFLSGIFLYGWFSRKTEAFQEWKTYLRFIPLLLLIAVPLYALTKVEDKVQGRNTGLEQLQKNFTSIIGGNVEGSLSGNIVWRLAWWGKIIDYTFAGPHFWTGKGLGLNIAVDDGIPADESTDRTPLRAPHNFHLHILARYGVPIFIAWLVFMVYLFKLQRVSTPGATTEETYFFSACLIAFLVNASFDVALEGPMAAFPFWIWVGLSLARQQMPLPSPQDRS